MDGGVLRCFDFEKPGFGGDIELPMNAFDLYDGGGDYCVCYVDSSCIWGVRPEGGEPAQLASLINCGLDENDLQAMFIDAEGCINCLLYDYDDGSAQLAQLKLVDATELPETTVLRLACFYLSEEIRRAVLDFNRSNSGVKIEVADYAQYATEDDYSAGLTKLNVEILSGNVPDLFASDGLPIAQYGARGLLCDMYELIDSDPELSRESFFENILDAFATDGKLYTITPSFRVADFQEYQLYEAMFGGQLAFKGYPSADRAGNIAEPMYSSLSISAACKDVDAAWSFVRMLLLEDSYDTDGSNIFGYPLNRAAYDAAEAAAMEKHYTTDPETGEQVEEPVSSWSWDALNVDIYAMTEEEAQTLRELIASVKYSLSSDETTMNMIAEESAAFFEGGKSAADTAALIQDRVTTYVNEQR